MEKIRAKIFFLPFLMRRSDLMRGSVEEKRSVTAPNACQVSLLAWQKELARDLNTMYLS